MQTNQNILIFPLSFCRSNFAWIIQVCQEAEKSEVKFIEKKRKEMVVPEGSTGTHPETITRTSARRYNLNFARGSDAVMYRVYEGNNRHLYSR